MQNKQAHRTNLLNSILLVTLISLISCVIGMLIGIGGFWYYGQVLPSTPQMAASPFTATPTPSPRVEIEAPVGEGIFIASNGKFVKIPEFLDDSQINFSLLPATNDKKPVFAIRGAKFPLGNLKLAGYLAGIGVDVNFTQTGAIINSVFKDSPAKKANLQPGEIIVSIDGKPVQAPGAFRPGQTDLFGPMQENITLVVLSGTNNRTIQLPRTYRGTVNTASLINTNPFVKFTVKPNNDYVILTVDGELKPGVYRFEFQAEKVTIINYFSTQATPTPTPPPVPLPAQKWIFIVN